MTMLGKAHPCVNRDSRLIADFLAVSGDTA